MYSAWTGFIDNNQVSLVNLQNLKTSVLHLQQYFEKCLVNNLHISKQLVNNQHPKNAKIYNLQQGIVRGGGAIGHHRIPKMLTNIIGHQLSWPWA